MKKVYLLLLGSTLSIATMAQQSFTTSGTFTVPPGVTMVTVEVVGAGGKGGGNGAGGGGGGGYAAGVYPVVPGATHAVIVGEATVGNGTSSVASLGLSATKGGNGISLTNPQIIGGGGAGGVGTGGQINRTGGAGGGGYWTYFGGGGGGAGGVTGNGGVGGNTISWTGVCQTPGGAGGIGGGFPGGNGGKGAGFTDTQCNVTDPSASGSAGYGGGGGGANGNGGGFSNGANGFVQFSWCNPIGAPTADTLQTFCSSATLAELTAQGTNIQWFSAATGGTALTATTPLTNNTMYYAQQDSEPCETVIRFPVKVKIITIDTTTTTAVTTITANQTGATYAWIDCATNQPIASQTGQSYTPTLTGSYAVIITDGACVDTSACVTISFVGVNELENNSKFKIFPNPATDVLSIEVTDLTHGSTYSIVDQHGRKVQTGSLTVGDNKLNIKNLKNGLYILKIGEKDSQTFKVIKE